MAPEAFPPFWEAQELLLASLRQEEFLRRCRACEEELELALLTRQWHSRIPQCLEAFSRLGGEPELLRCLASPPGGWLAPEGWCAARELAAWLRWDELLPQERTSLKRLLEERQPATMAGRLLLGRLTRRGRKRFFSLPAPSLRRNPPAFHGSIPPRPSPGTPRLTPLAQDSFPKSNKTIRRRAPWHSAMPPLATPRPRRRRRRPRLPHLHSTP